MKLLDYIATEVGSLAKNYGKIVKDIKDPTHYGGDNPVLILGGYTVPYFAMRNLRDAIGEAGFKSERYIHRWWQAIDKSVEELVDYIEKSYDSVSLVGWSLGGLISRDIAQRIPHKVNSAVLIGAPHNGAYLAYANFFVPSANDMIPGSDYLTRLNQQRPQIPILNIYSPYDEVVWPWWSDCSLEGSQVTNLEVEDKGHMAILDMHEEIISFLKS